MGGKQFRKNNGFTLIELIAVVAIISMIAVYITIEVNQSADDAKVGLATSYLASNIPAAISSYRAQNMSSCSKMATPPTGKTLKDLLTDRGITDKTAWDIDWTVAYNSAARTITIDYPIFGTTQVAEAYGDAIASNLANVPQVASATRVANTNGAAVSVVYNCF